MDLNLSGKTALIAASSQGLGRAIAEGLLKEGANIVISGRDESKLKQVVTEIDREGSGKVAFVRADVTNIEDIKKWFKQQPILSEDLIYLSIMLAAHQLGRLKQLQMKIGKNHLN